MRKLMPIILTAALCAITLLTASCERVEFDNPLDAKGNNNSWKLGNNVTAKLSERGTVLTISGTGAMRDYYIYSDTIALPPWHDFESVTKVIIGNGVTSVGNHAFSGNTNLTSVTIGNSVASIGNGAFRGCTGLQSITIPNSVISIGNGAFSDNANLTSVTMGNSVTNIGDYAFNGCSSLKSITIPNRVITIGDGAFYECVGLTSITIPNSVTSIGDGAFKNCIGLKSVTIGNSVTNIGRDYNQYHYGAFEGCTGLTSITIPNSVTFIGNSAFEECVALTSIMIPEGVTSIGHNAFAGCVGLTSITIPESVMGLGGSAFGGCTGLTSITIPSSVKGWGDYVFAGCSSLTSVTIGVTADIFLSRGVFSDCHKIKTMTFTGAGAMRDYSGSSSVPWSNIRDSITDITIGDSVTRIGNYAFSRFPKLTSVTIPDGVEFIGMDAFSNCTGLMSITIGSGVKSISASAFENCTKLTSVTSLNPTPPTLSYWSSYYPFNNIGMGACLYVPHANVSAYSTADRWIGQGGFSCVREITNGSRIWSVGTDVYAVLSDDGTLTISGTGEMSDYSSTSVPWYAFRSSITNAVIAESVTTIGAYTFANCANLTSVTIGSSVTSIGEWAFTNCSKLSTVTIPDSVTVIGTFAFFDCTGMTSIISLNPVPPKASSLLYASVCLYVPEESREIYGTAAGWSAFSSCILSIDEYPQNQSYGGGLLGGKL